jgi:predicted carbohydrate-binding protein with CBM5 and CBM33 domain
LSNTKEELIDDEDEDEDVFIIEERTATNTTVNQRDQSTTTNFSSATDGTGRVGKNLLVTWRREDAPVSFYEVNGMDFTAGNDRTEVAIEESRQGTEQLELLNKQNSAVFFTKNSKSIGQTS